MDALPTYLSGFLAVLLLTSFVKVLTTFSILRYGIGLEGAGFGMVIVGFSFALSLLIMEPQLAPFGGSQALITGQFAPGKGDLEKEFRPFLEKHTEPAVKERLVKLQLKLSSKKEEPGLKAPDPSFSVLISAFLVSELKQAFQIGFIILIPFIVIDLLMTNVLMALGITQISAAVVGLPFKILLFFVVDGWTLLTEKLLQTYS